MTSSISWYRIYPNRWIDSGSWSSHWTGLLTLGCRLAAPVLGKPGPKSSTCCISSNRSTTSLLTSCVIFGESATTSKVDWIRIKSCSIYVASSARSAHSASLSCGLENSASRSSSSSLEASLPWSSLSSTFSGGVYCFNQRLSEKEKIKLQISTEIDIEIFIF